MIQIPPQYAMFPAIDATLNGISGLLLFAGWRFIKRGRIAAHRTCMVSAVVSSTIFLACYLYYHLSLYYRLHVGPTHFQGHGIWRPIYFAILISHVTLAIVIVPMVIITLSRALRERFGRHRAIAVWTFPLWMYVSVTGVIVYVMLYHLFAA